MKINKTELMNALEVVKPGLSTKEIIDQTTSFAFKGNRVYTYNDEISITTKTPDLGFDGAIKASELFDFLKKVKNDEIEVNFDDETNEVVLKAGRAKVGFTLANEIVLPLEEELSEKDEWKKLPKRFLSAIRFTIPCASNDMSNPKITCVHLKSTGFAEATDNFRIAQFDMKRKMPVKDTIIPASSLKEVLKLSPTFVSQGNGWLHFKNENDVLISCRVFDEKFVEVQPVIDHTEEGILFDFPETLPEILEKAEIFTKSQSKLSDDEKVDVIVNDKKLMVHCQSETAWFKESVSIKDYTGENFTFSITPYLLKFILEQTNTCMIMSNMLRFEGKNWVYVSSLSSEVE
jgi:DNA polymerase III sliding clamp (beta) subunit (PCNA family)